MVPLLHVSTVSNFLVHRVNFKPLQLSCPKTFHGIWYRPSEMLKQKVVCKLHRSKVISLITCVSNWGRRRYLVEKGKKNYFCPCFKTIAWNCIEWKLNASVNYLMICCRKLSVMGNMVWKDITHFSWWI